MGKLRQQDQGLGRCQYCGLHLQSKRDREKHEEKCSRTGYPRKPGKQKSRRQREWKPVKVRH